MLISLPGESFPGIMLRLSFTRRTGAKQPDQSGPPAAQSDFQGFVRVAQTFCLQVGHSIWYIRPECNQSSGQ